jgi:hypothetical protein
MIVELLMMMLFSPMKNLQIMIQMKKEVTIMWLKDKLNVLNVDLKI